MLEGGSENTLEDLSKFKFIFSSYLLMDFHDIRLGGF